MKHPIKLIHGNITDDENELGSYIILKNWLIVLLMGIFCVVTTMQSAQWLVSEIDISEWGNNFVSNILVVNSLQNTSVKF